jgi:adenosine deaminase
MENLNKFLSALPKAELHLHIEGTLEPEMMQALAEQHRIKLPWRSVEEIRSAYKFDDLQSFLNIYYKGNDVLRSEQDFFDLTFAYLARAHKDGVRHAEIFFDPQSHTSRGIPYEVVLDGISAALTEGTVQLGITSGLILCFLRHLTAASAMATLDLALSRDSNLLGVGLDSSELGFPPIGFRDVFQRARSEGLHVVAHAGEEGPSQYIEQALDILKVERIDHGVSCVENPELVKRLRDQQIPLTVCPLSNVKLKVFPNISNHNIMKLARAGLCVTINSDDPAYFGSYINENYAAVQHAFNLDQNDLGHYARRSIEASFASIDRKQFLQKEINNVMSQEKHATFQ